MYLEIIILLSLYIGHAEQRANNPDGLMVLQKSTKTSDSTDSINEQYFPIISDETNSIVDGRMFGQNATKTKEDKKEEKQREKEEKKKEKEEEKKRKEEEKEEEKKRKEEEKKKKDEEKKKQKEEEKQRKEEEKQKKKEEKEKKKEEKEKKKEAQKMNSTKIF